jgi:hypothetical protein
MLSRVLSLTKDRPKAVSKHAAQRRGGPWHDRSPFDPAQGRLRYAASQLLRMLPSAVAWLLGMLAWPCRDRLEEKPPTSLTTSGGFQEEKKCWVSKQRVTEGPGFCLALRPALREPETPFPCRYRIPRRGLRRSRDAGRTGNKQRSVLKGTLLRAALLQDLNVLYPLDPLGPKLVARHQPEGIPMVRR